MQALCERLRTILLALGVLFAAGAAVNAQGFEDALAGFTADSFNDTEAAIVATAKSGDPRAALVIEALQEGRLLFSAEAKKVYIRNPSADLLDAATGQAVAGTPADHKTAVDVRDSAPRSGCWR